MRVRQNTALEAVAHPVRSSCPDGALADALPYSRRFRDSLLDASPSRCVNYYPLQLHRSFGIMVWLVTVLRLVWRRFARFPDWPANMSRATQRAAQAMEYALYGLLLLQPILGLLHSSAHGGRVKVFFLFRLPPLIGRTMISQKSFWWRIRLFLSPLCSYSLACLGGFVSSLHSPRRNPHPDASGNGTASKTPRCDCGWSEMREGFRLRRN